MIVKEILPKGATVIRDTTMRAPDASQRLLAAITVFALAASMVTIGLFMAVLLQVVPTITLATPTRPW
jgi:hypothetical protein